MNWVSANDCRIAMQEIQSDSISLILTDPPYFIDGMDDGWNHQKLRNKTRKAGVIGSLPIGMKFEKEQGIRLQEFMTPIANEWMRIIKPGGFVLCFSQNRLVHRAAISIEDAGFEIRDMLAWKYEGQPKAFTQDHFIKKRDIPDDEKTRLIKKLGGRKTPQLKPQCELIVIAQAPREGTFVDNWDKWQTGLIDVSSPVVEPHRFPGTVVPVTKPRERFGHITAKPVELMRHLIRIFSCENSKVFDPFTGSGSTGVAALLENRKFFGMEIDHEMVDIANQRIKDCTSGLPESQRNAGGMGKLTSSSQRSFAEGWSQDTERQSILRGEQSDMVGLPVSE